MKVLICGDRNWTNFEIIETFIKSLPEDAIIIEGDCRGADKIAGFLARKNGHEVEVYQADWKKYGKRAGPIRNRQMLIEGKPDLVVAFHNDIENSKGTKNMVNIARSSGLEVKIISESE